MAQLVLGAAGAVVGFVASGFNPYGAKVGFVIGSYLGASLEASKQHSRGPQLTDLRVVGSEYGQPIPWCMGATRMAGQIWWASDRHETSNTTRTGKGGGPQVTTYSYDVDLLIGLTDGAIDGITRIWLNGKLVWTNLTSATDASRIASEGSDLWGRLTVYTGSASQMPDPTYEAAVGITDAPAYRGRSFVFIEALQLGTSGQLPNLTFEVSTSLAPSAVIVRRAANAATTPRYANPNVSFVGAGRPAIVAITPYIRVAVQSVSDATVYQYRYDGTALGASSRSGTSEAFPGPQSSGSSVTTYPVGILGGRPVRVQNMAFSFGSGKTILVVGTQNGPTTGTGEISGLDLTSVLSAGEYIGGVTLCSDGAHAVIFTAPSDATGGGAVVNKWYLISYDGASVALVNSGALAVAVSIYTFGFGNSASFHFAVSMLEENLTCLWTSYTPGGDVYLYTIGAGNVMTQIGHLGVPNGLLVNGFDIASIWAESGFCIVVYNDDLCTFRRQGSSLVSVGLDEAVVALCARAGMTSGQIDATGLAASTKDVRSLAVGQIGNTRGVLEQLAAGYFFDVSLSDKLYFRLRAGSSSATIPFADLGAGVDQAAEQPLALTIASDLELPAQVALQYRNMSADQQTGTEYSDRLISGQASLQSVQLALGFTPAEAKGIADAIVADNLAGLATTTLALSIAYAALEAADVVQVVDEFGTAYRLRLTRKTDESAGVLRFDAVRDDAAMVTSAQVTDATYVESAVVTNTGDTVLLPLDIPLLRDADDAPGYYVAAHGSTTNWPGCVVLSSMNNVDFTSAAEVAESAVFGTCTTTLGPWSGLSVMDEANTVTVNVGNGELSSVTRDALLADETLNVLLIGSEAIRFCTATLLTTAPNTYKVTRLIRAQRGTDWAATSHAASERAALLRPQGLRRVGQQATEVAKLRYLKGVTGGKSVALVTAASFTNNGISAKPFAPVDLRIERLTSDDLRLTWRRRTRYATSFCGGYGISVPIGEQTERYTVQIKLGESILRSFDVVADSYVDYLRSDLISDFGYQPGAMNVAIFQIGSDGSSGYKSESYLDIPYSIAAPPPSPGAPPPPPPSPPSPPTVTAYQSNIIAETSYGVLALRIIAGIPTYYVSSGATMVPTGLPSTAFMSKGNFHTSYSLKLGSTVWYVGQTYPTQYLFASSVPDDYSAAPSLVSSTIVVPSPGGDDWIVMLGCDGSTMVAIAYGNSYLFNSTDMVTWTLQGQMTPAVSETYYHLYQYFPALNGQIRKLLKTSAGWLMATGGYFNGLYVYTTNDPTALTNWKYCTSISQPRYAETDGGTSLINVHVRGAMCYIAALFTSGYGIAVSTNSGTTWTISLIGQYSHFMDLGSQVIAIKSDGKKVAFNNGSSTAWTEYQTNGIKRIPGPNTTTPYGGFFIDTGYGEDVIIYTADGINWGPVT